MQGDCLELMKGIPDGSIDMILCDLPYGTTTCKWDNVIPFDKLWELYNRIIKGNGVIALFGREPFSSYLRISNIKNYRYDWIWEKSLCSNFMNIKKQPTFNYENVCIFYKRQPTYNPQMRIGKPYIQKEKRRNSRQQTTLCKRQNEITNIGFRYPKNIIFFNNGNNKNVHPTQKPIPLLEYLIKTYTNECETVLDNCMGSGSTGVACVNTGRDFIGIELEAGYFEIAKNRIEDAQAQIRI